MAGWLATGFVVVAVWGEFDNLPTRLSWRPHRQWLSFFDAHSSQTTHIFRPRLC